MNAKEKAKELVNRMLDGQIYGQENPRNAIQCALIAVNELIKATESVWFLNGNYWEEVKQEIENL